MGPEDKLCWPFVMLPSPFGHDLDGTSREKDRIMALLATIFTLRLQRCAKEHVRPWCLLLHGRAG